MKTEIKIVYQWLDEDLNEPSKEITSQLDESAERQINEQISKGFTSGEFSEEVFEKKYWCHWSRNTARVDENQPTPQMIADEKIAENEKNIQAEREKLSAEYYERAKEIAMQGQTKEREVEDRLNSLLKEFSEREVYLEKKYRKLSSDLSQQYSDKFKEFERQKEVELQKIRDEQLKMISDFEEKYSQKPKEEKPAVQFYQLGANLNLNHEIKIAHYPNGYEKKIENDAYRLFVGVGKSGLIEMLMNGETFKSLLKDEPIDAISLEDFKKNYL